MISKCRNHRIRLHALKLIKMVSHSEGIWYAPAAAIIAEKVMKIEEAEFYKNIDCNDSFLPFTSPAADDTTMPPLPQSNRIRHLQVTLPDNGLHLLAINYEKERSDGSTESRAIEYDSVSQHWRSR